MAIFYQHSINEHIRLGVWKIEENEAFFLDKVPVKRDVTHPYKRLQHLAGRYLLPFLFADFPLKEIVIADTKKPFLQNEQYHFSISHCGNYAAAIVSGDRRVGIDIELVTPRLKTIAHKFLNSAEQELLQQWEHLPVIHLELLTFIWSAKESLFKWYGNGKVDFKEHLRLNSAININPDGQVSMEFIFDKGKPVLLHVTGILFNKDLVLTYVHSVEV